MLGSPNSYITFMVDILIFNLCFIIKYTMRNDGKCFFGLDSINKTLLF